MTNKTTYVLDLDHTTWVMDPICEWLESIYNNFIESTSYCCSISCNFFQKEDLEKSIDSLNKKILNLAKQFRHAEGYLDHINEVISSAISNLKETQNTTILQKLVRVMQSRSSIKVLITVIERASIYTPDLLNLACTQSAYLSSSDTVFSIGGGTPSKPNAHQTVIQRILTAMLENNYDVFFKNTPLFVVNHAKVQSLLKSITQKENKLIIATTGSWSINLVSNFLHKTHQYSGKFYFCNRRIFSHSDTYRINGETKIEFLLRKRCFPDSNRIIVIDNDEKQRRVQRRLQKYLIDKSLQFVDPAKVADYTQPHQSTTPLSTGDTVVASNLRTPLISNSKDGASPYGIGPGG